MTYWHDQEVCEYCNGTIYDAIAYEGDSDYHADCYMERFADSVGELLVEVGEACGLFEPKPVLMAAE